MVPLAARYLLTACLALTFSLSSYGHEGDETDSFGSPRSPYAVPTSPLTPQQLKKTTPQRITEELKSLLVEIESGNADRFLDRIYAIGPHLTGTHRERLRNALSAIHPPSATIHALLFLLGMSTERQKSDLVRLFARQYYWLRHSSFRTHFPIGAFGPKEKNLSDVAAYSKARENWFYLSLETRLTAEALQKIYAGFKRGDLEVIRAMADAQSDPRLSAVDGLQPIHTSEFFLKLTTTGFALPIPQPNCESSLE